MKKLSFKNDEKTKIVTGEMACVQLGRIQPNEVGLRSSEKNECTNLAAIEKTLRRTNH